MRHLTPEELVDLAEGARPSSLAAPHLEGCESCRRQLADLTAMMAGVSALETSEPSPLYWDRFSARVREAVAAEGAPPHRSWLGLAPWSRVALPVTAAALAVLVIGSLVTMRVGPARDGAAAALRSTGSPGLAALDMPAVFADDPTLSLVADLAAGMDWDAANADGLASGPGGAEGAVNQLSVDERLELHRLLKEALKKPGA
jgi:anti-sigma factor RsiW